MATIRATESIRIRIRTYMSLSHAQAAAFFVRNAHRIEAQHDVNVDGRTFSEHRSYVVGAVMMSIAFLEAMVNELLLDWADRSEVHYKATKEETIQAIGALNPKKLPCRADSRILSKYESALFVASAAPFDKDTSPYKDIAVLIGLRNALVHYSPEWIPTDKTRAVHEVHEMEKQLQGRFPLSSLVPVQNPFYPDKVLGHGCARWAIEKSLAFAEDFLKRLEVDPIPFAHVWNALSETP